MSYTETITACAHVGLDPAFTAHVALARRNGHIADAATDLAAGWTATPPLEGWSTHLPTEPTPPTDPADSGPSRDSTARAVLTQWRHTAATPPTAAMT